MPSTTELESGSKIEPKPKFSKGDRVLGPWASRSLPVYLIKEVYSSNNPKSDPYLYAVGLVADGGEDSETETEYLPETDLQPITSEFIAMGEEVWRVSNGKCVATSRNWAQLIAKLLSDHPPEFPGPESQDK